MYVCTIFMYVRDHLSPSFLAHKYACRYLDYNRPIHKLYCMLVIG